MCEIQQRSQRAIRSTKKKKRGAGVYGRRVAAPVYVSLLGSMSQRHVYCIGL